ncbi:MAG: site-2 protease family protein [Treponema sp.]|nr:site-2 protease family protein [Treponema sp.]
MIAVKIALGLVGLGIVVFMHELGHFLACRLVGIDVEAFSIGWGKPILKKKIGAVEYRLGLFPVGGYCKMKGEADFDEAWKNKKNNIPMEKGSMMAASPLRRIIVAFAGPFFNFLFAVIVLSIIWGIGFDETVLENRIVLASEFDEHGTLYPADKAGLQSGDRIIEINGRRTRNHSEVQKNIVTNPEKELQIKIDRQGEEKLLSLRPNLDKNSGAGLIGVIFWTDPVIDAIIPGSIAEEAGLAPNDRIISVNNKKVTNTVDFESNFKNIQPIAIPVEYKRGGIESHTELTLPLSAAVNPGISWKYVQYKNPSLWPHAALAKGVQESWETLSISVKSLACFLRT